LPGFFLIAVVTSSDRGQFLCGFSFNFRGFFRGDRGLITDWYGIKGMKGVGEEPNHMIARKRKPGPLNPPKLLSKNPPNTAHASFCGFFDYIRGKLVRFSPAIELTPVMVNVMRGGGRAPPPSPAMAYFTLMTECTPESSGCYSVYSVVLHSVSGQIQNLQNCYTTPNK
jgi:hypothetical protein